MDLAGARANPPFDNRKLRVAMTELLSGATLTVRRQMMSQLISADPVFIQWKKERYFWSRRERIKHALVLCRRLIELKLSLFLNADEMAYLFYLCDDLLPIQTHETIFIPFLRAHCDEEQAREWIQRAENYQIIGCYAQTELGHGSNVSAIETTATFIADSDEWELDSPSLSATKWWIGGLGILATHAIVMANLVIGDRSFGVQPFIVPIRDPVVHAAFKGVSVGDIGPKMGANSMDNGFLRFNSYRIPRRYLLMRGVQVSSDGQFSQSGNPKLLYITMLKLRVDFVNFSALGLARASTIAVRYCSVRRQFGKPEVPVISYSAVQFRIIPPLAAAYVFAFMSQALSQEFNQLSALVNAGKSIDDSALADLHASSAGLKSFCTVFTARAFEECRMACGGHGYSQFSGFSDSYGTFAHLCTAEGENWLMTQQCTRWLLKQYAAAFSGGKVSPKAEYLLQFAGKKTVSCCSAKTSEEVVSCETLLSLLSFRAYYRLSNLAKLLGNDSSETSWNSMHVLIYRASEAHCQYLVMANYLKYLDGPTTPSAGVKGAASEMFASPIADSFAPSHVPLKLISQLLSLYWINEGTEEFLMSGYCKPAQISMIKIALFGYDELTGSGNSTSVFRNILPYCVALADGLGIPDYVLNSALGNWDGRVHERMWDWAVMGGYFAFNQSQIPKRSANPTRLISPNNLNRTYNRELYTKERMQDLPALKSLVPRASRAFIVGGKFEYDGDHDAESDDKNELQEMREWQQIHATVIRPLIGGSLLKKYKPSKI